MPHANHSHGLHIRILRVLGKAVTAETARSGAIANTNYICAYRRYCNRHVKLSGRTTAAHCIRDQVALAGGARRLQKLTKSEPEAQHSPTDAARPKRAATSQ